MSGRVESPKPAPAFQTHAPYQTTGIIVSLASAVIIALGLFLHLHQGIAISKEAMWGIVGGGTAVLCAGLWALFYTQKTEIPPAAAPTPRPVASPAPRYPERDLHRYIENNPPLVEEARALIQNPAVQLPPEAQQRFWARLIDQSRVPSRRDGRSEKDLQIALLLVERYGFDMVANLPWRMDFIEALLNHPNPPHKHLDALLLNLSNSDGNLAQVRRCLEKGATLFPRASDRNRYGWFHEHALYRALQAPQIAALLIPRSTPGDLNEALEEACAQAHPNLEVIQQLLAAKVVPTKKHYDNICKSILAKYAPDTFTGLSEYEKNLLKPFLRFYDPWSGRHGFEKIVSSLEKSHTPGWGKRPDNTTYEWALKNAPKLKQYIGALQEAHDKGMAS